MKKTNLLKKRASLNLALLVSLFSMMVTAQQIKVAGVVKSAKGELLPGVSIIEKGTKNGANTDIDGNYAISVNSNSILVISFIGMTNQEVSVNGKKTIDVVLSESVFGLNEVIVVGYQTQKKADLTGAVAVVDMDNLKDATSGNVMKSLQGLVAGVYIKTDGNPGGYSSVRIRGGSSLASGYNDPLYVIDGTPTTGGIELLNPNDIESMQVLKDASSSSIYGARASNGVILITTKKTKSPLWYFFVCLRILNQIMVYYSYART